jgi:regulatory protein
VLLEKILPSKKRQDRFELYFENGETLLCTAVEVADFSLYSERELTPEEYEALKAAAALTGTKERAAALLAYRAMSAGELERKLVEKGETEENAQSAVEWLSRLGALDDLEYAKSVVRHYSSKGWGAGRIKEEFYRRRIPREYWEDALEELDGEDEKIARFIERRMATRGNDPKERKKTADALYRRGFSWDSIKRVMAGYYDESYEDEY